MASKRIKALERKAEKARAKVESRKRTVEDLLAKEQYNKPFEPIKSGPFRHMSLETQMRVDKEMKRKRLKQHYGK
jgi:hypothetical protein